MSGSVKDLARRLEHDIRGRGLGPGHRYLTGEESAHLLGTSVATANRALQFLAEKDIVVRRRSSGTFVGPAMANKDAPSIRIANILIPYSEKAYGSVDVGSLVESLTSNLPDVGDVRISFVPKEGDVEFVRSLLEPIQHAGQLAGVIACSCSYEVYQYLGEQKLPFVVMGSLYPGQTYPAVETDERQAGFLLAQCLIQHGHRRMALFSNSESCPGDHNFHDGVSEAFTNAGLPHSALLLRAPGANPAILVGQFNELLAMADPPTGFLVRLPRWADDIAAIAESRGLRIPQDIEIAFTATIGRRERSRFPHVRPSMPSREVAGQLGRMLSAVRQRKALERNVLTVPFEMCSGNTNGEASKS